MSGIYIPNMEMPKSCGFCPFKYRTMEGGECMFNARSTEYQKRPSDCPLVHVPPHGRLIDADELYNHVFYARYDDGINPKEIAAIPWSEIYNAAPTIIPAEEGET